MPFIETADSLRSEMHISDVKMPLLIGVLVLVCTAAFFFGSNVASSLAATSFELESADDSSTSDGEESGAEASAMSSADKAHSQDSAASSSIVQVFVFVSGAVANPGVYSLSSDARVGDAINLAGGFSDDAATEYNNLARLVLDGEQIHVPTRESLENGGGDNLESALSAPYASGAGLGSDVGVRSGGGGQSALININTASQAELETLPGIGPSTAQKIIASRESDGPFNSIEELSRVSGIGEKKYAAVADLICV
ncbi:MAG: ComEA family DNA-binding protein [Eggerthellaceae bacterium]|nr:ComEA family DNA-binding protein [Eggerthellaceae bacterium]